MILAEKLYGVENSIILGNESEAPSPKVCMGAERES